MTSVESTYAARPIARFRLRGSAASRWLALGVALTCAFGALAVLGGFSAEPGGPANSSYATGERGVAAWSQLLARSGHVVTQLRVAPEHARLDAEQTVVLLEPDALLSGDGARLMSFVRSGGRLLYGSLEPQRTLPALLPSPPRWSAGGGDRYTAYPHEGDAAAGVGEAQSAGGGVWSSFTGYRAPLRAPDGAALLLEKRIGRGVLELLSDVSPLQNRLLARADNAQLALSIVGPRNRAVAFVESVHGYGTARGLAALPPGWRFALAGLVLAGLLWIAGRARRLGPAEPGAEAPTPARSAYAEALALLLRRTRDEDGISRTLERHRPQ